ncbi:MAG TPA: peptide chain release factor N(5)-glutamine methyltransferase [Bryobacteraceae bacterium]|nr:peptide chain release factor N(5)-glutamine methyltransferase [Bryobacteraceae bacterium]
MTVKTALDQGTRLLEDAHVAVPRLTAEVLLCHALRRERVYLYSHPEAELSEHIWIHYGRYLHERMRGKPTQYITGVQEFYGREFVVTPDVLIPRPETEHVIDAAIERVTRGSRVVDVGCGSGAIAATIALECDASVWASDISLAALHIASHNARRLGASVHYVAADLLDPFPAGSMDVVVSNPPYVGLGDRESLQREVRDFEPEVALYAGPTGNEIYQRLIREAERVLRPGGWLIFELGYRSLDAVRAMLDQRWSEVSTGPDLAGIPRVLCGRLSTEMSTSAPFANRAL